MTVDQHDVPHRQAGYGHPRALAEFENDIRRERQMDGIAKAKERGGGFGRKPRLLPETVKLVRDLRAAGTTVPAIMKEIGLSKASIYRALG